MYLNLSFCSIGRRTLGNQTKDFHACSHVAVNVHGSGVYYMLCKIAMQSNDLERRFI